MPRLQLAIRWKLLILLLGIAIIPLLSLASLDIRTLAGLGARLATETAQALTDQARASLEQQADDYARLVERERQLIELLARLQAREVERALAAPPPAVRVVWASDLDSAAAGIEIEQRPEKYFRQISPGQQAPIPVSFEHSTLYLAPGADGAATAADAARLAALAPFNREAHRHHDDIVYWQYTALENGVHASYPGHGSFPAGFDPRQRSWYLEQKARLAFNWSQPITDAISRLVLVSATMPVFTAQGQFAGVTGIDVRITKILQSLKLPPHLAESSQVFVTLVPPAGARGGRSIDIIARQNQMDSGGSWQELPLIETFATDDPADNAEILTDMRAYRDGFMRTRYGGRDSFCVYRRFGEQSIYLVFMVPAAAAARPAAAAANYALETTRRQIDALAPIAIGVALAVAAIAVVSSRAITGPVARLSSAVAEVAHGDFGVRVLIATGDELEQLGRNFNTMIPQLAAHTRVRESLGLARAVQQQLLPRQPPMCATLDIHGVSIYADETGGDYYDFIDLQKLGKLGVVVGDVAGHGVASALLMATARALLHGVAKTAMSPAAMLQHLNDHLVDDVQAGHFMTLFALLFDLEHRTASWASAGHDPAICYRPGHGEFIDLKGEDIPIGIDRDWRYTAVDAISYEAGDVILLATDGVWDTSSPQGERFGKARLRELLRAHAALPAVTITNEIVRALTAYRGTRVQRDDVTLVAIRVTG